MSAVTEITQANFEADVLQSDVPVLVDFWAPWCGPCRLVSGVVDEVAQDYTDRAKVVKINIDDEAAIASQYHVRSIPTLIVFKAGEAVDQVVGAVPKTTLSQVLDKHL
ncbi:MAG: thioredoxin [Cyanobacteria bacterium P01_H01_bin.58]